MLALETKIKKHYEVERRVNINLKDRLPPEAELKRIYGGRDVYFTLDPFLRVRDLKLTYPSIGSIQKLCLKKTIDGEVEEHKTPVDALGVIKILEEGIGKPKVIVEGHREEYSLKDLIVCVDNIKYLGEWTEIEKITKSKEEFDEALREVEKAFESLGISKNQLTKEIYPELLSQKYLTLRPSTPNSTSCGS